MNALAMRRLLMLLGVGGVLRQAPSEIRVADLRIYPVKSCGGISLSSARMAPTGLAWDRVMAIVDNKGRVQTQRKKRKLAAIRPSLDLEAETMQLEADGMEALKLPLRGTEAEGCERAGAFMGHSDPISGMPVWRYPAAVTEWLTRFLAGTPGLTMEGAERPAASQDEAFHLVRFDGQAGYERRVANDIGGENALPEDQVAFPDLFPILLTTRESLHAVNSKIASDPVPMERFRPNIVVEGTQAAFDEDAWAVVTIGDSGAREMTIRCLEQDPRCQIPSIDQRTGRPSPQFEPSRTLRGFRKLFDPFGRAGDLAREGPMFGVYAAHGGQAGKVRVGDILRVVERSDRSSLHEYWSARPSKTL